MSFFDDWNELHLTKILRLGLACILSLMTSSLFWNFPAQATERPPVMGPSAGISAGDPLTTAAAFETLIAGGNAFDAGVAALLVGGSC